VPAGTSRGFPIAPAPFGFIHLMISSTELLYGKDFIIGKESAYSAAVRPVTVKVITTVEFGAGTVRMTSSALMLL
jgi:hypothetical protein